MAKWRRWGPILFGVGILIVFLAIGVLIFGISWMLSGGVLMMLSVHMAAFALDRGLPLEIAALALTAYGLGAVVGRIVFGAATDRFGVLPTMLVCAAIQIGSLAPLPVVTSAGPLLALLLLYGAGVIGGDGVFVKAVPDVFGVRALGGIMGVLAIGWRAGAASGPAVAGFVQAGDAEFGEQAQGHAALEAVVFDYQDAQGRQRHAIPRLRTRRQTESRERASSGRERRL